MRNLSVIRVCSYLDYRENVSTSLLTRSRLVVKITEFKLHCVHIGRKVFPSPKISLADRRDLGNLDNFLSHTNTAFPLSGKSFYYFNKLHVTPRNFTRCRAEFMTCEIHDYYRSAHAHTMRMIDIGSEISQVDDNSTCVSCFGGNLCSFLKSCDFNFELSIN